MTENPPSEGKHYYRADKRPFEVGEVVITAGEFADRFKATHQALERNRPSNKPLRNSQLFVFEDEASARDYWSKLIGGCLYEVSINERSIALCADMQIVEQIAAAIESGTDPTDLCRMYWNEERSDEPIVEILVPSATVTRIVSCSQQERRAHFKRRWMMGLRE